MTRDSAASDGTIDASVSLSPGGIDVLFTELANQFQCVAACDFSCNGDASLDLFVRDCSWRTGMRLIGQPIEAQALKPTAPVADGLRRRTHH